MRTVVALSLLLTVGAGCSSTTSSNSPATFAPGPIAAANASSTTAVAVAPPVRTGILGTAQSLGCSTDLDVMKTVMESFLALNGRNPDSEAELVSGGLLATESAFHDIGPGGTIVPSPTGGCAR